MMTARNQNETFDDYRRRIKDEAKETDRRLKGTLVFMSRSAPFKNEKGEIVVRTATYRKKK